MNLSLENQEKIKIVIPVQPTSREKFAAEELQKYLRAICGATFAIVSDQEKGTGEFSLLIGSPSHNAATASYIDVTDFHEKCPGPEGIFLQSYADAVVISGSDGDFERGTIYAVYELLERYYGAALSAYCAPNVNAGEYLPKCNSLPTERISYCKKSADLPYRAACVQYEDEFGEVDRGLTIPFLDWLVKNRYNRVVTWTTNYDRMIELGYIPEFEKRGIRFTVGHHSTSKFFVPPYGNAHFSEHYRETHPEFYRLLEDGTRYDSTSCFGQWIFCSRNTELPHVIAANMKQWLRENPLVDVIFFPPNDGIEPQCVCEECSKYSKVDNYLHVLNQVATEVAEEFPKIETNILAYIDLFDCPDNVKLHPAISVQESTWHLSGLRSAGKKDGSCLLGTFFEDNLLKWKRLTGAHVTYYEYYMSVFGGIERFTPMADEIQAIFRGFLAKGIDGSLTQIECFNLWNHLFNFYTFGRTGYDTNLSMEDNLASFIRLFGEGGGEIAGVIRYAEDLLDGQADIQQSGKWLMEHIDKEKVYAMYDKALAKTTDPLCRNNIRMMRMVFRYSDLSVTLTPLETVYHPVNDYHDESGELNVIAEFDSFWKNYVGYGIDIPARGVEDVTFEKNIWYLFD